MKKITKALLIQSVDPLENGEKFFNIKINDDNLEYIALKKLNIINEINNISIFYKLFNKINFFSYYYCSFNNDKNLKD